MIHQPESLAELRAVLGRADRPLVAGGFTTLRLEELHESRRDVVTVQRIPAAAACSPHSIGAAVTLAEIEVCSGLPVVVRDAAASIGSTAVRSWATLGGNVSGPTRGCLAVALGALWATTTVMTTEGIQPAPLFSDLSTGRRAAVLTIEITDPWPVAAFVKRIVNRGGRQRVVSVCAALRRDRAQHLHTELTVAVGGYGEDVAVRTFPARTAVRHAADAVDRWQRTCVHQAVHDREHAALVSRLTAEAVRQVTR